MNILVTGGAGYIGSQMVRMLATGGQQVVVVDSLEHGYPQAIPATVKLYRNRIDEQENLRSIFQANRIEAVIHFAGYISMEESVINPRKYLQNNLIAPITLLETMLEFNVKQLIFSSTAGVYGNPTQVPIPEDHPKNPLNPYGLSKWCFEEILKIYADKGIRSITLRYFNAAGADRSGYHGEDHRPETHIIPIAINTALGKLKEFKLYGKDYPTRDGSCVRDYIHVEDLCNAHLLTLEALSNGHKTAVYNVGTGEGVTNQEMIKQIQKESGVDFPVVISQRRSGDAAELIADSTKLKKEFNWKPQYSDLTTIVATAWKWHSKHPKGYS